jgi:hypothetical protein
MAFHFIWLKFSLRGFLASMSREMAQAPAFIDNAQYIEFI